MDIDFFLSVIRISENGFGMSNKKAGAEISADISATRLSL